MQRARDHYSGNCESCAICECHLQSLQPKMNTSSCTQQLGAYQASGSLKLEWMECTYCLRCWIPPSSIDPVTQPRNHRSMLCKCSLWLVVIAAQSWGNWSGVQKTVIDRKRMLHPDAENQRLKCEQIRRPYLCCQRALGLAEIAAVCCQLKTRSQSA